MKLSHAEQILTPLLALNSTHMMEERRGVIIRGETDFGTGYFEYFPWTQFGDLEIESFLEQLKIEDSPLYHKVNTAVKETAAYLKSPHLISFYNHQLIYPHTPVEEIYSPVVKLKYMGSVQKLVEAIERIAPKVRSIRIDFNFSLSLNKLAEFFSRLEFLSNKIEYIEDPVPFDPETYALLASWDNLIRIDQPFNHSGDDANLKRVYKPAINPNSFNLIHEDDIFSSYMGHPIGKVLCTLLLEKYGNCNQYHGIETPLLYCDEPSLFDKRGEKLTLLPTRVEALVRKLEELPWKSF